MYIPILKTHDKDFKNKYSLKSNITIIIIQRAKVKDKF